ncbi:hypothetical protein BT96DRAFT_807017 [Gymnopus androsaceus JB14]|uniref:SnoaL-like domain-containing protein n=1 Tax=Gymnopus androsaceus JB14 TaxID=1447944 RepID=A0A6A4IKR9_9AGAR|nr:hypothetical protein BT96DRAFT_807017 [Gymnopus androsaceus JB14]
MSATNAAGLEPSQSKKLEERSAQAHEQEVIRALKEMYSCSPQENTFSVYTPNAVFKDPIGIAEGVGSIKAQFIGLTKLFPRADITKFRVLANPPTVAKNTLLIDQDVAYFRDSKSASPTKSINSLLTLQLDDTHKITSHIEEWNHSKSTTGEDGFLGTLNEHRKKMTAKLTDTFVGKD